MCFTPQRRALFRHLDVKKWSEHVLFLQFWLGNVLRATTACTFSTFGRHKVVRTCAVFTILTWKCASRHNGVHFFDIWTSQSGPNMLCFYHFDLEMCFAPQRRALFLHLNFQKWSETVGYWHFWLGNVLRATTACTFMTSQLPKVVRTWRALYILTWKCAARHNGVHFFDISTSKSGPNLACFVHCDLEMCFAPQRRALFRHLNFQKCSEREVFLFYLFGLEMCFAPQRRALFSQLNFQKWSEREVVLPFWLGNVLRATMARTFPSLIWPAGSAPAALARLLFDAPEPQIIGKTQWIALPYLFVHLHLVSSDFLHLLSSHFLTSPLWLFPPLLFHLGSLTSKLPSIM